MTRIFAPLAAGLLFAGLFVGMLGGVAGATHCEPGGSNYPPAPDDNCGHGDEREFTTIVVTNPEATITIRGRGWRPGQKPVEINRHNGPDAGHGKPGTASTTGSFVTTAPVNPDGTFEVTFSAVEADREDGVEYVATGPGSAGEQVEVRAAPGETATAEDHDVAVAGVAADLSSPEGNERTLAASGGPFTVGSAIMLGAFLVGTLLLVRSRRGATRS